MNSPAVPPPSTPASASAKPACRPSFSIFIATACGLGYLPKAPGTWGSLGGVFLTASPCVALYIALYIAARTIGGVVVGLSAHSWSIDPVFAFEIIVGILVAAVGVRTAGRAAQFWGSDDPQKVVIDEVSGQQITLVLGCVLPIAHLPLTPGLWGPILETDLLNWKYLLVGFILFRAFDIWKPFPARQAERLRGGWGIMADDWIAGIYAAIGLWIARAAGL
jgi:phosphatidylglycerophosphatase A